MPRLTFLAGAAGALIAILTAYSCGPGGIDYDPNKGLIMGPEQNNAGQTTSSDDEDSSGLTLGKLFGPSASRASGYVVGDEPYAVKAGADILAQGGSAADAATAIYFTLSVTYPGAAGLGGGGLCLVHDMASGRTESIDFLARDAAGGGAYAVPGNVRGFAALQARYGALPWQRDIAYAEALAATGFPISDALAARLKAAQNVVRLDAGLAAEFLDESGQLKPAGTVVAAPALSQTLAVIRQQGGDGFYKGSVAHQIVTYSAGEGGAITAADLAVYQAHIHAPQMVRVADQRVYLPPSSVGAGSFAAAVMSQLVTADGTPTGQDAAAATRAAVRTALERFGVHDLPGDMGATGFAALDKKGQGVACAVTMNGPFGSGHTASGTGVTLASAPSAGQMGLAAAFLTPVLALKDVTGPIGLPDEAPTLAVSLAGAGAGGPGGTAAIASGVLRLALDQDVTKPGDLGSGLRTPYDTVNAIACQHDICAVLPDMRAHGLGAAAGPGATAAPAGE